MQREVHIMRNLRESLPDECNNREEEVRFMDKYDVIVVGAGPAGSMAAKEAAKGGASVLVIERKKEIGAPVRCGEGIGSHWLAEMDIKVHDRAICKHITGSLLVAPDMKSHIKVRTPETKGIVVDRKVFDKDLAIEAAKAGAEIMIKSEVTSVKKENGRIAGVVVESNGMKQEFASKVLIAADGGESTIARMAGLNSVATLYDTDFGVEYEMANVECEDLIEIYFGRGIAPRGYFWVFPKENGVANVGLGIGGKEKGHAIDYLNKVLKLERFKKAQPLALKAGIIPVGAPMRGLVLDGFMVAGTAAHQVDPIHGGGICLAMDAGLRAGRVASKCALAGKTDAKSLYEYEEDWRNKREAKLLQRLALRKVIEKLSDEDLNVVFGTVNDEDVEKLLKSEFVPVVKKVLMKRPQLLKALDELVKYKLGK
jgi:digeranylgeranylglycerophospholipid reductase